MAEYVQHYEVLFIGPDLSLAELRDAIEEGLDHRFTRMGHKRTAEWQLEVATLDAEDAHLG